MKKLFSLVLILSAITMQTAFAQNVNTVTLTASKTSLSNADTAYLTFNQPASPYTYGNIQVDITKLTGSLGGTFTVEGKAYPAGNWVTVSTLTDTLTNASTTKVYPITGSNSAYSALRVKVITKVVAGQSAQTSSISGGVTFKRQ